MKIIDCFMYFDEDMILDIRLNVLSKYVSKFIICEANFHHNGTKKGLKFDIKKFSKFNEKIIYIPLNNQPTGVKTIGEKDTHNIKNSKILDNALLRENYQRNYLQKGLSGFDDNDLVIISDLDEIPNLNNFKYKNKITFFEQKMFYYKLNLFYPNFIWYGSKICKKKDLINPQWLRNIKPKKYQFWRLDTLFSNKKYNDLNFIKNGGWHFTNVKKPELIDYKMKNFLHHLEYEKSGLKIEDVKKKIAERKVFYDHNADKRKNKWSADTQLIKIENDLLPDYISANLNKFEGWLE